MVLAFTPCWFYLHFHLFPVWTVEKLLVCSAIIAQLYFCHSIATKILVENVGNLSLFFPLF